MIFAILSQTFNKNRIQNSEYSSQNKINFLVP
jgi:hypothetical protein